jgi:hypothetical protein
VKVERTHGLAWREVGGEVVVIHLGRHRMFGLSGAAAEIWEALDGPMSFEDFRALVAGSASAAVDIDEVALHFLADLVDEDLVACDGIAPAVVLPAEISGIDMPRIDWREEVQQFAGQCHFLAGQSQQCTQHPGGS